MSKATGKYCKRYATLADIFMTHKQGGDEFEGLLSAKFDEEIK